MKANVSTLKIIVNNEKTLSWKNLNKLNKQINSRFSMIFQSLSDNFLVSKDIKIEN